MSKRPFWKVWNLTRSFSKRAKKKATTSSSDGTNQGLDATGTLKMAEESMALALRSLRKDLSAMSTGRAAPSVVEGIDVVAYGGKSKLKSLAAVTSRGQQTLGITAFDASTLESIEKAIRESRLGMNPIREEGSLIVHVPKLSEETKSELLRIVGKNGEQAKVSVRHARKEAMNALRRFKEEGESEDALRRYEKQLQTATDVHIKDVEHVVSEKSKEIQAST